MQQAEPDLRKRIVRLARKNLGQPYDIYLLGEMPFETYDPQPIYCLTKSDCVVFAEHTYAMALTGSWPEFMKLLQRIRYRDGQIGVATRNHYTEADWVKSNQWLVTDITGEIAGDKAVPFEERIDRKKFLKGRYDLDVNIPVEVHRDSICRTRRSTSAEGKLQDGDFVNVVRGVVKPGKSPAEAVKGQRVCRACGIRGSWPRWHAPHDSFDATPSARRTDRGVHCSFDGQGCRAGCGRQAAAGGLQVSAASRRSACESA